jgi:hypothetical protein
VAGRFLPWYRRYYLLINLPVLFLVTELALAHYDVARRQPSTLDVALAHLEASPPGAAPVLLLVGNSGTLFGIDEDQLAQALARPEFPLRVYNFGLAAARIDDTFELIKLLLARGIKPTAVVLGVNPFLVDDHAISDSLFPWLSRTTPYLYFHRSRLRGLLKKLLRDSVDNPEDFGLRGTNLVQTEAQREFGAQAFLREFAHRPVDDFPLLAQLPELLAWLDHQRIPTYVVVLPLSPDGTRRLDTYAPLMAALRSKLPADRLDLADAYPYGVFKDVGHLNALGRQQLTAQLAAWLKTRPGELAR